MFCEKAEYIFMITGDWAICHKILRSIPVSYIYSLYFQLFYETIYLWYHDFLYYLKPIDIPLYMVMTQVERVIHFHDFNCGAQFKFHVRVKNLDFVPCHLPHPGNK